MSAVITTIGTADSHTAERIPPRIATDLQDDLLMVINDLDRLQALLGEACSTLLERFLGASRSLHDLDAAPSSKPPGVSDAVEHLARAATALQFQDMATQLIAHTRHRLRHCTDTLANEVLTLDDEDGEALIENAPLRPNPVTQDEMDAGSIDLF